ncbi:hypothetical protein WN48_05754 [Eufriesea mexicana]|uniref:Uncharacterized protein n=1 Tax=Eufriesea mexicana TaxID=516756 RepID=A0A310SKU8_9HYME|nr:hypothetical protein WN48_05754 [Eufriesea mexicana]
MLLQRRREIARRTVVVFDKRREESTRCTPGSHILHTLRYAHCVSCTISLRKDSVAGHKNTLSLEGSAHKADKEG